jgi:hypothetical protein
MDGVYYDDVIVQYVTPYCLSISYFNVVRLTDQ